MALTARKKRGIGFLIGGVAFLVTGGIFIGLEATPDFLGLIFQAVGMLAELFGFKVVFPDTDPVE